MLSGPFPLTSVSAFCEAMSEGVLTVTTSAVLCRGYMDFIEPPICWNNITDDFISRSLYCLAYRDRVQIPSHSCPVRFRPEPLDVHGHGLCLRLQHGEENFVYTHLYVLTDSASPAVQSTQSPSPANADTPAQLKFCFDGGSSCSVC